MLGNGGIIMICVGNYCYEILKEHRDAFNEEAFKNRYVELLNKYDYIVGDWGYQQLRLKGFFEDTNPKSTHDTKISTLPDYIFEYCNFGCPYFVLKKVRKPQQEVSQPKVDSEEATIQNEV